MRNSNMQHIVQVAAGVYVFYLGCKLLIGGVIRGGMTGKSWYIGLVFGILFIVIGGWLAVLALRNLNKAKELEDAEKEEEEASVSEDLPEPTPAEEGPEEVPAEEPAVRSLFDRAGAVSHEDVSDETDEEGTDA